MQVGWEDVVVYTIVILYPFILQLLLSLLRIIEGLAISNMLRVARTAADRVVELLPTARVNVLRTGAGIHISRIEVGV
jgi:hypothetical protein